MAQRRGGVVLVLALITGCAPALTGGPHHPRWRAAGDGSARGRLVVGSRYDPTGRVDGYFQGDRRISLDELLHITGHGAQAERMATRRWLRPTLMTIGAAVIVGGLAYSFSTESCTYVPPMVAEFERCNDDMQDQRLTGGVVAIAGAAIATTGLLIGSGRPAGSEVDHWASEYNRANNLPPITRASVQVRIGAAADRHGAGLVVAGGF
ncbi:MAG: hypothetical protein IPL61_00650 [Myxococcales bacterium]|nr:hypothetical protein [Myxococcales bacterium]